MKSAKNRSAPRIPVFHIPHTGDLFPDELMESVCISSEDFFACHGQMKDAGATMLTEYGYQVEPVTIVFPFSRLLCDVERFIGPEEVMERYGMGFCYEKAFDGRQIKIVNDSLRRKTMKYYLAHHERLDTAVSHFQRVLLLDLHSFSEELVMPDRRDGRPMPEICIGSDPVYTPSALEKAASSLFMSAGFSVAVNYPYEGSLVPNAVLHGRIGCDLITLMIEMNRAAIFGENGEVLPERIARICEIMDGLIGISQAL